MDFGDRLMQLLEENNISQKEFAEMLHIAPTTLNGYIKNKRQPDFKLVKRIASIMNVSADYLLGLNSDGISLSAEELSYISKLRKMSDSSRQIIYDLVNIIAQRNM